MSWNLRVRAVDGEPAALKRLTEVKWSRDAAVGAVMLLLEKTPHPAAALVVAGIAARERHVRPVAATLTPHATPALAEWRADPDWAERCIGIRDPDDFIIHGVAHLIAALRDDPAALRDAVGIVARNGGWKSIDACLAALGAAGWGLLDDKERGALWASALFVQPAALGFVWTALSDAQREEAVQRAAANAGPAAALIGRIGAAAWTTTDAALRDRLIAAAAQAPWFIHLCAPAWDGMSDKERERLTTAVVDSGSPLGATDLLDALGGDGRRALSAAQRGALDTHAVRFAPWLTTLLRVGDAGWGALSGAERRTLMEWAEKNPLFAADLIRAIGIDGRRAPPPDVQATLRASVQREPSALLACPPALWHDLADGRPLPPASSVSPWVIDQWIAEDAAADLSRLPREHQALVLAIAPWHAADCVPSAARMARLLDVWNDMTAAARADLATALPQALAVVAAAVRLAACEPTISETSRRATSAVEDTLAGIAQRDAPDAAARATVGRMLAAQRRWRSWMRAFAPTGSDPSNVWEPWIAAAQRGAIPDRGVVPSLMMPDPAQSADFRRSH